MFDFFKKLITNNTGISIKNFGVFVASLIALIHISMVWILVFTSFFSEKKIDIPILDLSIFIASIEVILLALMGLKVASEKNERTRNSNKNKPFV